MLLNWRDDFSVGVNSIDVQHKKLVSLLNDLNEAMKDGRGNDALGKVFRDLVLYTKTHFSFEERLMETHGYPDFKNHKGEHDELTGTVKELYENFQGGKTMLSVKVMNFLKEWLSHHILKIDRKLGAFLKAANAG